MIWKNAKNDEPTHEAYHLIIIRVVNNYVYAFAFWDGEEWIYNNVKDAEIIAFTETDPKSIISDINDSIAAIYGVVGTIEKE